jgi:hypothetical protein
MAADGEGEGREDGQSAAKHGGGVVEVRKPTGQRRGVHAFVCN